MARSRRVGCAAPGPGREPARATCSSTSAAGRGGADRPASGRPDLAQDTGWAGLPSVVHIRPRGRGCRGGRVRPPRRWCRPSGAGSRPLVRERPLTSRRQRPGCLARCTVPVRLRTPHARARRGPRQIVPPSAGRTRRVPGGRQARLPARHPLRVVRARRGATNTNHRTSIGSNAFLECALDAAIAVADTVSAGLLAGVGRHDTQRSPLHIPSYRDLQAVDAVTAVFRIRPDSLSDQYRSRWCMILRGSAKL